MGGTDPGGTTAMTGTAGRLPGAAPVPRGGGLAGWVWQAVRATFSARSARELAYCAASALFALVVVVLPFLVLGGVPLAGTLAVYGGSQHVPTAKTHPPAAAPFLFAGILLAVLVLLAIVAPQAGRVVGAAQRRMAARLLGERIPPPRQRRAGRGLAGRLWARLADGPGWRALAYPLVKLPLTAGQCYAAFMAVIGPVDMTYPLWWHGFRNHPPTVHLSPALALTPLGALQVATFPGTFAAFAAGAAMLVVAPWLARAVNAGDRWLMRGMLGPGWLAQRVADLEESRALAVEDAAARLRHLERDLHDGTQIRLATLAMNLGLASDRLGAHADPLVAELVTAAHRDAKQALAELRDLVKGIHPPVLDAGLAEALATLATTSAIPATLVTDIPARPDAAIETIAYFCAAELLANAVKHSHAHAITITATGTPATLVLVVADDGRGGAAAAPGGGLAGLAQRVRTVDGHLDLTSPPGGPTRVSIMLPLHTRDR
ncbi:MAG TPA: sensor domain-containing protein [Streptosporangiaceae bacterium]|nr:sensor domain-containing protein [Streptosporangiaceae bacterium]